jgi:hypothetical protein
LKTWGREGAIKKKKKKKKKIHKDFVNKFDQLVFLGEGGLDVFPFYSSWGVMAICKQESTTSCCPSFFNCCVGSNNFPIL